MSVFEAEVLACHKAIQRAKDQSICKLEVWTDSQLLVDVLSNRVSPFWSSSTLIADIRAFSKYFDYLVVRKVKRLNQCITWLVL
ncbi:unnamed protein product [Camellia sinensis]